MNIDLTKSPQEIVHEMTVKFYDHMIWNTHGESKKHAQECALLCVEAMIGVCPEKEFTGLSGTGKGWIKNLNYIKLLECNNLLTDKLK